MNLSHRQISTPLLLVALATGCSETSSSIDTSPQGPTPAVNPGPAPLPAEIRGTAAETMDSGGYTYVLIDTGDQKVWAAGPVTEIEVGETVALPDYVVMPMFHSNTLDRDFEKVLFTAAILTPDRAPAPEASSPALPPGHPALPGDASASGTEVSGPPAPLTTPPPDEVDVAGSERVKGGWTIAELHADHENLSGKEVLLRGTVVKYAGGILGRNWIHIQDGSGDPATGTHDLTVTSTDAVAVGDTVTVRGILATDRDFGAGYAYSVIVEEANVTAE